MRPWSAIATATAAEHRRLRQGLEDCEQAQRRQLADLMAAAANTEFGRQHGFDRRCDPDAYRAAVPLSDYDDFAAAIGHGPEDRLLGEPVLLYEETGGSSGKGKLIPYTRRSLAGFEHAVQPWLHDLVQRYPNLGRGYFAISPAARKRRSTADGVPIGSPGDALYFGMELMEPVSAISLMPDQIAGVTDIGQWQRLSLLYLLRAADLTFLSVWSPTFVTVLLAELPRHAEALLRDLRDGLTQSFPGAAPIAPDPVRAAEVERALGTGQPDTPSLWPDLQLISTWTHGSAARFLAELRQLFPHADLQGKGLLATEGVVSLPLNDFAYPVLAANSGFFEFLDDTGRSQLAHETVSGQEYEVVMSVPGLYRYRNGDRVRVRGWAGAAPQLEFVGRGGLASDLVGEKLSESFVCECLKDLQGFAMLAPSLKPAPHYQLFVEKADVALREDIEMSLKDNPQYAYARALGQLGPLELISVRQPMRRYQARALAGGQRLGDIKPPSLRPETDWEAHLCS